MLVGCSSSPTRNDNEQPPTPQQPAPRVYEFAPERYPAVHAAAVETLRDHGFRIARNDYRFGQITTYPKESPTVAEFWIDDAGSFAQSASDTLNAHQRTARVRVEGLNLNQALEDAVDQDAPAPAYTLTVEVLIERLQRPDRYLTASATGRAVSTYAATPNHLRERGIDGPYAQPLTRDPAFEARLLEDILQAVSE